MKAFTKEERLGLLESLARVNQMEAEVIRAMTLAVVQDKIVDDKKFISNVEELMNRPWLKG